MGEEDGLPKAGGDMKTLTIRKFPDPNLRKKCEPVVSVTEKEKKLFREMLNTMRRFKGVGLAAPQVGIARCLIVADIGKGPLMLANPEIVEKSGRDILAEGWLSVPGAAVEIVRDVRVVATGLDSRGERVEMEAEGLLARVLQHEIDHLNGVLILDYLPFQERCRYGLGSTGL